MRPDAGEEIRVSATVDCAIFPENVVIADLEVCRIALELQILGFPTHTGEREKLVAAPDFRVTLQDDVRVKKAVLAEFHVRADDTIRPDADVGSDCRER